MKLTPELLAQASASLNPVKERQLDLRGEHRQFSTACPFITALQATKSQPLKIWESREYVRSASDGQNRSLNSYL